MNHLILFFKVFLISGHPINSVLESNFIREEIDISSHIQSLIQWVTLSMIIFCLLGQF